MSPRQRIVWWEPWRHTRRRTDEELKGSGARLLNFRWWVRLWIITILTVAVLVAGCFALAPAITIPWWPIVGALTLAPAAIALALLATAFAPLRIELRRDAILFHQGANGTRIALNRLIAAELQTDVGGDLHLAIRYLTPKGRERVRTILLSPTVDREALESHLAGYRHELAAN